MALEIQFVNFEKSQLVRKIVAGRVLESLDKYAVIPTTVKIFFGTDGDETHVKIFLHLAHKDLHVTAVALDVPHAIDKALARLEVVLRKVVAKRKNIKKIRGYEHGMSSLKKRENTSIYENVFDKYEKSYSYEFEEGFVNRAV